MKVEEIAGRRTGILRTGQGEPALFLHCGLAHSGTLSGLTALMKDRLQIVAPDLPGHGTSIFDPDLDIHDQAVETAIALLENHKPAHLFGHSIGATIALRIATERPELVASLSLFEPVYFSLLPDAAPLAYAQELIDSATLTKRILAQDWTGAARAFLDRWGQGEFDRLPAAQQNYIVRLLPTLLNAEQSMLSPAKGAAVLERLPNIKMPVLLMRGAHTPSIIAVILEVIAGKVPQAQQQIIAGAGHMGPISHATEIASMINAFLFAD